jgi:hypothetical protein
MQYSRLKRKCLAEACTDAHGNRRPQKRRHACLESADGRAWGKSSGMWKSREAPRKKGGRSTTVSFFFQRLFSEKFLMFHWNVGQCRSQMRGVKKE